MVLGLTGRYCSGKSTVGSLLQEYRWHVIEVDGLGHQALEELKHEVTALFGEEILSGGTIDRSRLGQLVFGNSRNRLLLESVVHPWMKQQCEKQIRKDQEAGINSVINAALLHYMELDGLCDHAVFVHAPLLQRFYRAKFRDGINLSDFFKREGAQKHIRVYNVACRGAVFCIRNTRGREFVRKQLDEMLRIISKKD